VFATEDVEAGTLLLVSEPLATCPIAPPPGSKAARSTIRPISLVEQLLSKMFNPGQLKWLQVGFQMRSLQQPEPAGIRAPWVAGSPTLPIAQHSKR
jgi:hypothetical protein